ncbi:MlaD family protein [Candidatus Accumulibacter sp. ACC003]|uniref:MlaD family protein n=1 Tax=Candidatus Accumulibacter sp. ACC003 TaxID=2823334 RepID=UPI0025BBC703|nr:MlaD family protein [Candidatus Accumulibacter sp. ACC003]
MPTTVRYAEFKAAALVALTIALIGAFIVYVMSARGVFEETQRLVLIADNSEGVKTGMDLTFSGFPIGRVRRAELAADGNVRIVVDVSQQDAHWLRSSSVFTMERSLVGDIKIRAFSTNLADPPLPDGAERVVLRGDLGEQIPQLMASMRAVLENLERLSAEDSPLNGALRDVQSVTQRMQGPYGAIAGVLGSDENARKLISTLDHANTLLDKTDVRVFGKGGVMDESKAAIRQLHGLLRDARENLKKVDALLLDAQAIAASTRTATADLDALRSEVDASLRKSGRLIDALDRKWPFARDTEIKLP